MCGIYGSTKMYSDIIIRKKLDRMKHRGPDYSNFVNLENKVILGHNRLSIIDLDKRSNQPFYYHGLYIVFNGEIYNYPVIKKLLLDFGYDFQTTSDTEVICAAYLHWGYECLTYFNGMFSFVIYDTKKDVLFGSRDRLGKKPFFYSMHNGSFEFCSQLLPISINNNFQLNISSLSRFLVWSNVPEPDSMYEEVSKLMAGHYFIYNISTSEFKLIKYWDININEKFLDISYHNAMSSLTKLLDEATSIRMISDVPLGVFLSGGIDSSLIASFAQQNSMIPIKTFSVKFEFDNIDESGFAKKIANYLRTDHTTIECSEKEALDIIDKVSYYFDEPFGDSSAIPTLLLVKESKKNVTVALGGDGGDEAFLGYTRYHWIKMFHAINMMPNSIKTILGDIINKTPMQRATSIGRALHLHGIENIYNSFMQTKNKKFLHDESRADYNVFDYCLFSKKNILERVSDYDIKSYLNNDINTKIDRASMAFSLECRSPLMDYRIIEFSRSLPTRYKYLNGNKKRILKDILGNYIPKELYIRPKAGFAAPIATWFRNGLKEYVYDSLTYSILQNIPNVNPKNVQDIIFRHMSNKEDNSVTIWNLLMLAQWVQNNKSVNN